MAGDYLAPTAPMVRRSQASPFPFSSKALFIHPHSPKDRRQSGCPTPTLPQSCRASRPRPQDDLERKVWGKEEGRYPEMPPTTAHRGQPQTTTNGGTPEPSSQELWQKRALPHKGPGSWGNVLACSCSWLLALSNLRGGPGFGVKADVLRIRNPGYSQVDSRNVDAVGRRGVLQVPGLNVSMIH